MIDWMIKVNINKAPKKRREETIQNIRNQYKMLLLKGPEAPILTETTARLMPKFLSNSGILFWRTYTIMGRMRVMRRIILPSN